MTEVMWGKLEKEVRLLWLIIPQNGRVFQRGQSLVVVTSLMEFGGQICPFNVKATRVSLVSIGGIFNIAFVV